MSRHSQLQALPRVLASLTLALGLLQTACTTGYQPSGLTGGFKDVRIDDSHYTVQFFGNGNTGKDQVYFFWLNRCAELTKAKGYKYFVIEPKSNLKAAFVGGRHESFFHDGVYRPGDSGEVVKTAGHVTTYTITTTHIVTTWSSDGVVAMFGDPAPSDISTLVVAQAVLDQLAPYVQAGGHIAPPSREDLARVILLHSNPAPASVLIPVPSIL